MRKILMPLLIIPLGMLIYVCAFPNWQLESPGLESLILLIGLPILILNYFAWFQPEVIEAYFPIKDNWGRRPNYKLDVPTIVISAMVSIILGANVVSAASRAIAGLMLQPETVKLAKEMASPVSVSLLTNPANLSGTAVAFTLTAPAEVDIVPAETAQIPVSGGEPTKTPAVSMTPTEVSTISIEPTKTAGLTQRCVPASPEYLQAVWHVVEDADPDSEVEKAWAVQSNDTENLWLVAAKIYRPGTGDTLPGVWALFDYSNGDFDIYSINNVAMDFSFTASGDGSDPVITMQSDGAQEAYDCAANAD